MRRGWFVVVAAVLALVSAVVVSAGTSTAPRPLDAAGQVSLDPKLYVMDGIPVEISLGASGVGRSVVHLSRESPTDGEPWGFVTGARLVTAHGVLVADRSTRRLLDGSAVLTLEFEDRVIGRSALELDADRTYEFVVQAPNR